MIDKNSLQARVETSEENWADEIPVEQLEKVFGAWGGEETADDSFHDAYVQDGKFKDAFRDSPK